MILIFLVIAILALVFAYIIDEKCRNWDGTVLTLQICGFALGIVSMITIICLCISISGSRIIDEKIKLYETENIKIETQVTETVNNYMGYEKETIEKVKPESTINLVTLYPELKSDALVSKQIEVYLSNNNKIKELKESELEYKVEKWWLYFGG